MHAGRMWRRGVCVIGGQCCSEFVRLMMELCFTEIVLGAWCPGGEGMAGVMLRVRVVRPAGER